MQISKNQKICIKSLSLNKKILYIKYVYIKNVFKCILVLLATYSNNQIKIHGIYKNLKLQGFLYSMTWLDQIVLIIYTQCTWESLNGLSISY